MIRSAKPSEIEEIIAITKACAAKMITENIYQWNHHYPNKIQFEKDLFRKELYVLLEANRVIGCVTISTYKDIEYEDIKWLTQDSLQFYIHRLAIHPEFQHSGKAKKLMDFAEDFAKQQKAVSIRLDTFSQNKRNQKFYEARGYQKLGSINFPKQSTYPFYCYEFIL